MAGSMPDITPAQIIAYIAAIVTQLVNFGLLSGRTAHLVVGLAGIVVPATLLIADAIIRHGRSRALVPTAHTVTQLPTTPPPPA